MIGYKEYEETVFNWLMAKHKEDPNFTFSLRQVASKGSETDYFIGTEKSNYFATTFWYIPVSYPGNAQELIGLIFKLNNDEFSYTFQFLQSKKPHNGQNEFGLELIRTLKPEIKSNFTNFFEGAESSKMENFGFSSQAFQIVDELLIYVDEQINKLLPLVDRKINEIKQVHPEFRADRYSKEQFDVLVNKLEKRRNTYLMKKTKSTEVNEEEQIYQPFQHPLNQILYGPPGTGKTFNTMNRALAIIHEINVDNLDQYFATRSDLKKTFDNLLINDWDNPVGQIGFITFHQSMSYEDFIEGIKPLKPLLNDKFIKYEVQDGIFKKMCSLAKSNYENSKKENKNKLPFQLAFEKLKEEWDSDKEMKFPLKTDGYDFTIIGFTNTSIQFRKASGGTSHTLSINTLEEIYYGKEMNFKRGVGIYYPPVYTKLNSYSLESKDKIQLESFVLIIDEINRGNVSQIFGELITLIETDKRLGENECLRLTLPYSQDNFVVPPNLYIIGTMNTADRSVEALDTALRRRFVFEEMMPRPELLHPKEMIWRLWDDLKYIESTWKSEPNRSKSDSLYNLLGINPEIEEEILHKYDGKADWSIELLSSVVDSEFAGIRLDILLETINKRIERLLSRDNCIGHSYFMKVYSVKDLMDCFKNEIIPLLQEYFYGDYGKMCLVLGKGFVDVDDTKSSRDQNYFAKADYDAADSYLEKKVWRIKQIENEAKFKEAINLLLNK